LKFEGVSFDLNLLRYRRDCGYNGEKDAKDEGVSVHVF